jgi:hypothetical protein
MSPDLIEREKEALDLLGELRRLADLPLVEVLVLERLVEALDDAVGLGGVVARADVLGPVADILPTRRLATVPHA